MGEIADMILDGILDEQTGEYIGKGVGYPRTMYSNSKPNPVFGVQNFLNKRGITDEIEYHNVVRAFSELPPEDKKMNYKELTALCKNIQNDFSKFINFTRKYLSSKK